MRSHAFLTFVVLLVVTHLLLHVGFGLGGAAPDLMAVAVLLSARRTTAVGAAGLGLGLGILDDSMGIGPLGARSLALGVAALLGTWSRGFIEGEGPLFILAYLFVGKWVADIVHAVVAPGRPLDSLLGLVTLAPLEAAWAAVAGSVCFALFRRVAGPDA